MVAAYSTVVTSAETTPLAVARTSEKPVEPVFQGFAKRLPEPIAPDLLLVFDQHHCAAVEKAYEGYCPLLNPVAT